MMNKYYEKIEDVIASCTSQKHINTVIELLRVARKQKHINSGEYVELHFDTARKAGIIFGDEVDKIYAK
jgi:ATP-dependent protease HslVU (ClpYQ) ATPase subunit